ncbi:MAG: SpaA isopeptide-forming pilin-related protein [Culicoidibacterales bacterium]
MRKITSLIGSVVLFFAIFSSSAQVTEVRAVGKVTVSNIQLSQTSTSNNKSEKLTFNYRAIGYAKGDTFTVSVDKPLTLKPIVSFPLLTVDQVAVAMCKVEQAKQVVCTFNEKISPIVEGMIELSANFYETAREQKHVTPVRILVDNVEKIHYVDVDGQPIKTPLPIFKSSEQLDKDTILSVVKLNQMKQNLTNVHIVDKPDTSLQVDLSTIKVYEVTFDKFGEVTSQQDVTSSFTPSVFDNGFEMQMGDVFQGGKSYAIEYHVKIINHNVNSWGNRATITADQITNETFTSSLKKEDGRGTANGIGGVIEVRKEDSKTKEALEGAMFNIVDASGAVVEEITTDQTGVAKTKKILDFGTYFLIETKAPKNHVLDTQPYAVTIDDKTPNHLAQLTVQNRYATGKIEIVKHDAVTQDCLAGAEFDVKDEGGIVVEHLITDKFGVAITGDLPFGNYEITETKSPVGYLADMPIQKIKLINEHVKVSVTNTKNTIPDPSRPNVVIEVDPPQEVKLPSPSRVELLPDTGKHF